MQEMKNNYFGKTYIFDFLPLVVIKCLPKISPLAFLRGFYYYSLGTFFPPMDARDTILLKHPLLDYGLVNAQK